MSYYQNYQQLNHKTYKKDFQTYQKESFICKFCKVKMDSLEDLKYHHYHTHQFKGNIHKKTKHSLSCQRVC